MKLYEPVHPQFERFCRARVYGHADHRDIMNDTLLVAFQKLDELKSEKAFLSFLFSICVRLIGSQSQKKKETEYPQNHDWNPIDATANAQVNADVNDLYQAMSKLPADQQECLLLFEITGFKIKEIAEIQNASVDAVKQRLKRGRSKLAELLTFEASLKTVQSHE